MVITRVQTTPLTPRTSMFLISQHINLQPKRSCTRMVLTCAVKDISCHYTLIYNKTFTFTIHKIKIARKMEKTFYQTNSSFQL